MISHAFVHAAMTCLNPYTLGGLEFVGKHLGRAEVTGDLILHDAKEKVLLASELKIIPRLPKGLRLVTDDVQKEIVSAESKAAEIYDDRVAELQAKEAEQDRRRKPLIFLSAIAFSLPAVTAFAHHGSEALPLAGAEILVSATAHIAGITSGILMSRLGITVGHQIHVYLRLYKGHVRSLEIPWHIAAFIGRTGATFTSTYYLTHLLFLMH